MNLKIALQRDNRKGRLLNYNSVFDILVSSLHTLHIQTVHISIHNFDSPEVSRARTDLVLSSRPGLLAVALGGRRELGILRTLIIITVRAYRMWRMDLSP